VGVGVGVGVVFFFLYLRQGADRGNGIAVNG
jgi:hypothetical protein